MKAFISYSHRDERFRISLETHLTLLKRNGVLDVWHDRRIGAGSDLDEQIDEHLEAAQLVLALVSPDFICFRLLLLQRTSPSDEETRG